MSPLTTLIIILGLAGLGYLLGRRRAVALVAGDTRQLHSRPAYHGWLVALLAVLPPLALLTVLLVVIVWLLIPFRTPQIPPQRYFDRYSVSEAEKKVGMAFLIAVFVTFAGLWSTGLFGIFG